MELSSKFTVNGSADEVFLILLDMEQVARCMPGATLIGRVVDRHQGTLKLKVGPVTAAYEGSVAIVEADHTARRAILRATGNEMKGQGMAEATIVADVLPANGHCEVIVTTQVEVSGRAAQFGRSLMADVTQRVIDQFSQNLEAHMVGKQAATIGSNTEASEVGLITKPPREDRLNVFTVVGLPVLKRTRPYLFSAGVGLFMGYLLGRRRR